jgi:hypothetical protein
MLSDIHNPAGSGTITDLPRDASILAVVSFVETHLIVFSREYADSTIKNENGLTQELVVKLNFNAKKGYYPFWFEREYLEETKRSDSPRVDIGTISSLEGGVVIESKTYDLIPFFSMEAKRLDKRSREYLIGRFEKKKYESNGGVERFKQGIHGRNLKYGALIGYVQKYDFTYWHDLINSWINDLIQRKIDSPVQWFSEDNLKKVYVKSVTAKFVSINSRKNDSITLFHLWVDLK